MKISKNWLKQYIDISLTNTQLVDKLTDLGLECNILSNSNYDNIIVGFVERCYKHPNADRLNVCEVKVDDTNNLLTIVCGAPNIKKGIFVPVAMVGSKIGDFKIKTTTIRDVVSNGMICSGKELGINNNHDGIMELAPNSLVGDSIISNLGIKSDVIFDFDLTPNRGDCFSHLGIAREIAILENKKIFYSSFDFKSNGHLMKDLIEINIENSSICKRYSSRVINNVVVKESPIWLQAALASIGQTSINNVVDIANYVMFDTGQPLHAFDYNKISDKKLYVKQASKSDTLIGINDLEYKLDNEDIIIADNKGPIAIAGVIGGSNSHVTEETVNILVESAIFDEISVRRTSKKKGLSTESSKRFERGVDFNGTVYAMNKFIDMVINICGGEISEDYLDIFGENFKAKTINLNLEKCNNFLGIDISKKQLLNFLKLLSIDVNDNGDNFICSIPSYRNDIDRDVDLYEEVARVYGYNNISNSTYFKIPSNIFFKDINIMENKIKDYLYSNGFNEHYSNSLYSESSIEFSSIINESYKAVELENPLSQDMAFLRTSLMPGMLDALLYNKSRNNHYVKLFEIGSIHEYNKNTYSNTKEYRVLGIAYLIEQINTWKGHYIFDIYNVKTDVSNLLQSLGVSIASFEQISSKDSRVKNGLDIYADNDLIGKIRTIDSKKVKGFSKSSDIMFVEIDLDSLFKYLELETRYKKPSIFPASKRDISILVKSNISHHQLYTLIQKTGSTEILKSIKLFDIYSGDKIEEGFKSLSFSLLYQSESETLSDHLIDADVLKIINSLKKKYNIVQR